MAGNFWQSSHNQQWILDKQDILRERGNDLKILTEEEYQKIMILFANFIQELGIQLKLRQQVIATATVFFKRFYARNSLKFIDPLLLAPTCVLLASKVEEFGLISPNKLLTACQNVVKNKCNYAFAQEFPYRMNHINEVEFFLLELLDCCLIVYHPYRPLTQFIQDLNNDEQLHSLAWKVANDSLRTDVSIMYPPYQIALACLLIASVMLRRDMSTWFSELSVDMEKVLEVVRHIMSLYQLWKTYDERREVLAILHKLPKPQTQHNSDSSSNLQSEVQRSTPNNQQHSGFQMN